MRQLLPALVGLVGLLVGLWFWRGGPSIVPLAPTAVIVCFGDSLTSGYGAPPGIDYPTQLAGLLGRPVINAGVAGDTTKSALQRLQPDVLDHAPGAVLITLGGNDLKNGVARTEAFANLKRIIETIQQPGALVIVGGIHIAVWDRGFSRGYQQVCDDTGAVLVADILDNIMGQSHLMSDSIHPNGAGYGIMAQRFYQALRPYL